MGSNLPSKSSVHTCNTTDIQCLCTRCLTTSTTLFWLTDEIPKISLGGEPLNGRCRCTGYNSIHVTWITCMQWIKYGAAADVCADSQAFWNFIVHHYALVHRLLLLCRFSRSTRSLVHAHSRVWVPGSHTFNNSCYESSHYPSTHDQCPPQVCDHMRRSTTLCNIFVMQVKTGRKNSISISRVRG